MTRVLQEKNNVLSVAPMLDWTDTHFRTFLRLICHHAMLYTEMIAAPALLLGDRCKLLTHTDSEAPLTLQLGGSDPILMAECTHIADGEGFAGININAGCPSSRVQSGRFGAVLMKTPEVVADCIAAMRARTQLPISVKTRISLSDVAGDGFDALFRFSELVTQAGCRHLVIHARKAKLNISPKDNRGRLPLDYDTVYRLKKSFPDIFITINGNITTLDEADSHLNHVDGVMIGRAAYGNPYMLRDADRRFFGDTHPILSRRAVLEAFFPYLEQHSDRLSVILPHLMGLFHGEPNARIYRQILTNRDLSALKTFIHTLSDD